MASATKNIFFIYKSIKKFTKSEYKALDKRSLNVHLPFAYSTVGEPKNKILKLPLARKNLRSQEFNSVFIIDLIPATGFEYQPTEIKLLNITDTLVPIEIFSIKEQNNNFEVRLNYSGNRNFIGEPKRDDFYLFPVKKNKPVKIIINGEKNEIIKRKREKVYLEHVYLLEYLGAYQIGTVKKEIQYIKRRLPFENAKTINLRRLFY